MSKTPPMGMLGWDSSTGMTRLNVSHECNDVKRGYDHEN